MKKQIVINASKDRSRIAIVEDGELVELYIETPDNVRSIGNVYLAEIQKVMPALRAAFVDVGQKQDCFLHFSDLTDNLPQLLALAGEDVPGLDEPVLSLAPPKRVADDEDEPDVEESLEIEPAPEESRSRRTSRRRSRGRGRNRGRGKGREEEEEQEERPRRAMPSVIDLSSPAKPRRPSRPAQEAPEPAPPETEEPDAAGPDASAPVEEAAPKKARTRSRKKADPAADAPPADAEGEADAEADANGEAEAAPKKARSRRKKPSEVEEEPADADQADDAKAEKPKAKRSRKKAEPTPEPEASDEGAEPDDAKADDADSPKPKAKRSRKKAAPAPEPEASDEDDASDDESGDAEAQADADRQPDDDEATGKRRRRGRRGGRGKTKDQPSADASDSDASGDKAGRQQGAAAETGDEPADKEAKPSRRSRGRTKDAGASDEPAASGDQDAGERADGEPSASGESNSDEPKRSRRSLPATLDLTSSAKPKRSTGGGGERSTSRDSAPKGSDGDRQGPVDETSPRGFKKPEPADEAPADETTLEDTSSRRRSGRGRTTGDTDGQPDDPSDADDAQEADASDDRSPRSRRRSRGGRGRQSDSAAGDEDASEGARSKGSDSAGSDSEDADADSASDDADSKESGGRSRSRSANGRGRGSGRSGDNGRGRSNGRGGSNGRSAGRSASIPPNEELLKRGGKIIVKITKEAISNKGPRVSTDLSLAGRFLVLVPAADYVAVSKKIESAKERRRLRTLATNLKPDGFGVIVRTVAEGRDAKSLDTDLRLLADKWRKIQKKLDEKPNPPVLLYQDVNMVSSVIRDLFSEDYDRILVDDEKTFRNVQAYVKAVAPQMADKVEFHKGRGQVYRSLGIEKQVEEAFSKRVNMRGGGYLFIETTEAMHVVDVNSGRAGRGKSQKQNLIDVNVEAAREVAKQLRLRDLGGIIVVDFIDLKYDRDRRKVTDALKKAFEKDRAVTKLLPMSDFGLVQITRQRLRPSITAGAVDEDGEPLDGLDAMEAAGAAEIVQPGKSMDVGLEPEPEEPAADERRARRPERAAVAPADATPQALADRLRGWLETYRQSVAEEYRTRPIVVTVHPLFGTYLRRGFPSVVTRWRLSIRGINFTIEDDASVDPLSFDVRDQKSGRSLLKKYAE